MAGVPVTADLNTQPLAALQAAQLYGPSTQQALRRSQYLADALHQLQASAQQPIRGGWGELGAKLLASALLQKASEKGQDALAQAAVADRANFDRSLTAGTPLDPNYQAPALPQPTPQAPPELPPTAQQPPPVAAMPEAASARPVPPTAPDTALPRGLRNNNPLNLKGSVNWHGMTGVDPDGYAIFDTPLSGIAAADHNLQAYSTHHGLNTVAGIIGRWAPAGDGANDPNGYAATVAKAMGVQPSDMLDMASPGTREKLMSAMAGVENGRAVDLHQLVAPQLASPGTGAAPPSAADQALIQARLANPTGQLPPAAPQEASAGLGAQPIPQLSSHAGPPPLQTVTPQEWAVAAGLLSDPRTHDLGVQEVIKLRLRAASALQAPDKMMWDAQQGRYVPMPGTETTQLPGASPSDAAQKDAFGNISHSAIPGVQGPVPEGMVADGKAGYVKVPTQAAQTFHIPGQNGLFVMGPGGTPQKVADDQYGPEQLITMRNTLEGQEPVKRYREAISAWGAMVNAATQAPGGMRAYALRDTFARLINPGAVARVGTIQAIENAQGIPANVKAFFMNLTGDGNVPPEIAQQIMDVAHGFLQSHYGEAKVLNDTNLDFAKRHGIDPADITVKLGDLPTRFAIPTPKATGAQPPPAGAPGVIHWTADGRMVRP
jgi:hypothetical protein